MTGRLLWRFLRGRVAFIILFLMNTVAILTFVGLLLSYEPVSAGRLQADVGYAGLLSVTLLVIYLLIDLVRWWPVARQVQRLLEEQVEITAMISLPAGGTADQEAFSALFQKLYRLSAEERHRYMSAHQRHLAFINLWVHQMKTPVSAINLIAQQAADEDGETLRLAMASVEEETAKLTDGLELILNMARLQDFALDYKIERVDLLTAVRRVVNGRKKQFIRVGIFPEVIAPDADYPVLTDDKWNRFVIDQVVANALKYGAQFGQPGQRIRLELRRAPGAIVLAISDQGPGIPPQDLPRLFEPFFTGENGRRYADATGIGLYLVKGVMDSLGHQIAITSEEGQGTTVTLTYTLHS